MEDPPLSHIYNPSNSSAYDAMRGNFPSWELEHNDSSHDGEDTVLMGVRAPVPKAPGEKRDSVCLTAQSHRRFIRVNYHLKKAMYELDLCPFGKDIREVHKIIKKIDKPNLYFYMRDITKAGLTIPIEVICAVYRGFYRRRPEYGIMAANFYKGIQLHIKNGSSFDVLHPKRGHFLGHWTEGMTLLQYAIDIITNRRVGGVSRVFSAVNDDMVAGFEDKDAANLYSEEDMDVCNKLCIDFKDTKSGITYNAFVYLEEYIKGGMIEDKSNLLLGSLMSAKYCMTMPIAKRFVYNIFMGSIVNWNRHIESCYFELVNHWGYEFYNYEHTMPFEFGGWLPYITNGLNDFKQLWDKSVTTSAAYFAVRYTIKNPSDIKEEPWSNLGRKLEAKIINKTAALEQMEFLDLTMMFGTRNYLKEKFLRGCNNHEQIIQKFTFEARERQRIYQKVNEPHTVGAFEHDFYKRHPGCRLRPHPDIVNGTCIGTIKDLVVGVKNLGQVEAKLLYLAHKKVLNTNLTGSFQGRDLDILIRDNLLLANKLELPLSKDGISSACMSERNAYDYYKETGYVPLKIHKDDSPTRIPLIAQQLDVTLLMAARAQVYMDEGIVTDDILTLQMQFEAYCRELEADPGEHVLDTVAESEHEPLVVDRNELYAIHKRLSINFFEMIDGTEEWRLSKARANLVMLGYGPEMECDEHFIEDECVLASEFNREFSDEEDQGGFWGELE
jgi:hypothetical protein